MKLGGLNLSGSQDPKIQDSDMGDMSDGKPIYGVLGVLVYYKH